MLGPALEAAGLGKRYFLQTRGEKSLSRSLRAVLGAGADKRPLWAVRGVDLVVARGEFVGVVGPNGAGKTTLLRLLAGLLTPTEGRVGIGGQVSPFLRIGAGLYSDLTVLENIRLAGALYGMSRREVGARLDAIVSFGEIEPYLYARLGELSAGYQTRVVFSTALHSRIDILLFDEIFSAGDAQFSEKCTARMQDLQGEGKTMVLATHDLELVRARCKRTVYLEGGRLAADGLPSAVICAYRAAHGSPPAR